MSVSEQTKVIRFNRQEINKTEENHQHPTAEPIFKLTQYEEEPQKRKIPLFKPKKFVPAASINNESDGEEMFRFSTMVNDSRPKIKWAPPSDSETETEPRFRSVAAPVAIRSSDESSARGFNAMTEHFKERVHQFTGSLSDNTLSREKLVPIEMLDRDASVDADDDAFAYRDERTASESGVRRAREKDAGLVYFKYDFG